MKPSKLVKTRDESVKILYNLRKEISIVIQSEEMHPFLLPSLLNQLNLNKILVSNIRVQIFKVCIRYGNTSSYK